MIDISGDGVNNLGRSITQARDEALAQGVVINGLPLLLDLIGKLRVFRKTGMTITATVSSVALGYS